MSELDAITGTIIDEAMRIHRNLGPGLFESVYEAVLARALEKRGLRVERRRRKAFEYDGMRFDEDFRVDHPVSMLERRLSKRVCTGSSMASIPPRLRASA